MKNFITTVILLGYVSIASAQFSIQLNPSNGNAVDILYTPPAAAQGVHPIQRFEFSLQVPNPQGANMTATFIPGAPLAAIANFNMLTTEDYGNQTWAWSSSGVPNYSNTYNFDGSEVILGTVTFSADEPNTVEGAIVSAIDYQNQVQYGGATEGAIWTIVQDPSGNEVTDFNNLFYQSSTSDAPTTDNDGGVENQRLSLSSSPLPIKLADFIAQLNDKNTVDLNWVTFSEHNNKGFDIERSANGRDFIKIGYVASLAESGNSDKELLYMHVDENPLNGTNYYRLKPVTLLDSTTNNVNKMTKIVEINTTIKIYPNPVLDNLVIKGLGKNYAVSIFNVAGQLVFEQDADAAVLQCNVMNLAAGTYTIKVTDVHNVIFTGKLIKNN